MLVNAERWCGSVFPLFASVFSLAPANGSLSGALKSIQHPLPPSDHIAPGSYRKPPVPAVLQPPVRSEPQKYAALDTQLGIDRLRFRRHVFPASGVVPPALGPQSPKTHTRFSPTEFAGFTFVMKRPSRLPWIAKSGTSRCFRFFVDLVLHREVQAALFLPPFETHPKFPVMKSNMESTCSCPSSRDGRTGDETSRTRLHAGSTVQCGSSADEPVAITLGLRGKFFKGFHVFSGAGSVLRGPREGQHTRNTTA